QVRPWRDGRRSRPRASLLSGQPRHFRGRGAAHADRGLRRRRARPRHRRRRPHISRASSRTLARSLRGNMMSASARPLRHEAAAAARLDPHEIRRDFPVFETNPGLVFLDTAASAQKPRQMIDGLADYYRRDYANVHRGVYRLSARSTELYEDAREKVRRFLNAADAREIVFVRNATEAINLVAYSWGQTFLKAGDEVLITEMEHHANIVPWQLLRDRIGIKLVVAPLDTTNGLDMARFEALLSARTKLVAVTHVANVTGAVVPVESVVRLAHAKGAKVLLDGCQAAPRLPIDMQALDCDFY